MFEVRQTWSMFSDLKKKTDAIYQWLKAITLNEFLPIRIKHTEPNKLLAINKKKKRRRKVTDMNHISAKGSTEFKEGNAREKNIQKYKIKIEKSGRDISQVQRSVCVR